MQRQHSSLMPPSAVSPCGCQHGLKQAGSGRPAQSLPKVRPHSSSARSQSSCVGAGTCAFWGGRSASPARATGRARHDKTAAPRARTKTRATGRPYLPDRVAAMLSVGPPFKPCVRFPAHGLPVLSRVDALCSLRVADRATQSVESEALGVVAAPLLGVGGLEMSPLALDEQWRLRRRQTYRRPG